LPSAFAITESCHLHLRGTGGSHVSSFELSNGLTGVINLVAAGGGDHTAHQWFYSLDNGVTWIQMTSTIWAQTSKMGLIVGSTVWFDHQLIDSAGPHPLDGPRKITVQ
jgi:hypothetical protein